MNSNPLTTALVVHFMTTANLSSLADVIELLQTNGDESTINGNKWDAAIQWAISNVLQDMLYENQVNGGDK